MKNINDIDLNDGKQFCLDVSEENIARQILTSIHPDRNFDNITIKNEYIDSNYKDDHDANNGVYITDEFDHYYVIKLAKPEEKDDLGVLARYLESKLASLSNESEPTGDIIILTNYDPFDENRHYYEFSEMLAFATAGDNNESLDFSQFDFHRFDIPFPRYFIYLNSKENNNEKILNQVRTNNIEDIKQKQKNNKA
ncbi:MAG: hypothetical protein HDS11_02850 [Bacteroides sp.]|nr:hypothetical protein [Bacteroides sp.]